MTLKHSSQPLALPLDAPHPLPLLPTLSLPFIPVLSLPVPFHLHHFPAGLEAVILNPEQSSSTILRADILIDTEFDPSSSSSDEVVQLEGYTPTRRIRRRILPSRPQFDGAMEQECLFYERRVGAGNGGEGVEENQTEGLVLLLPDLELLRSEGDEQYRNGSKLPYYHPQVSALAFRFFPSSLSSSPSSAPASSTLRIDLIPLYPLSTPTPPPASLPPTDRLYRTALSLLKFSAKLCQGQQDGWQKRVHHDLLVGKEEVQDLYQVLKEKYSPDLSHFPLHSPPSDHPRITFRHLLQSWQLDTDPVKHVFEDVAIVAWLICVWRRTYPENGGKPYGGFVDVGCGNGLLVHLLHSEGYEGYGFDLRARKSWEHYTPIPSLRVLSLDPVSLLSSTYLSPSSSSSVADPHWPFPPNAFLIGNHADEMTPWLPLLAAATPGPHVGYLSIPCCLHELSGRFERQAYAIPAEFLASLPSTPSPSDAPTHPEGTHPLLTPFYAPSPAQASSSSTASPPSLPGRYGAYQSYLAHLSLLCGFIPEREALRIPSTKNFGILGRRRVWDGEEGEEEEDGRRRVREQVRELVEATRKRGEWKARRPEGKAGEH